MPPHLVRLHMAASLLPPSDPLATLSESTVGVAVDTTIYGEEALFRACYQFTEKCYLFLRREGDSTIVVEFRRRNHDAPLTEVAGAFCNELIDQRLRVSIARDTAKVRELIVRQAFAEASFDEPAV